MLHAGGRRGGARGMNVAARNRDLVIIALRYVVSRTVPGIRYQVRVAAAYQVLPLQQGVQGGCAQQYDHTALPGALFVHAPKDPRRDARCFQQSTSAPRVVRTPLPALAQ